MTVWRHRCERVCALLFDRPGWYPHAAPLCPVCGTEVVSGRIWPEEVMPNV